ncbi:hypothetical protein BH23BAC2_BH23BAC2_12220 [soil metagenome]
MKNLLIFISLFLLFSSYSCSKQDDCDNPVDCLPPATQTGANTAGCLVNGEILLPGGRSLGSGSVLHSQYLFHQGAYIFSLGINDRKKNQLVSISTKNVELEEGILYTLTTASSNSSSGIYVRGLSGSENGFVTNETSIGELKISRIDRSNRIVSGTFWFNAMNGKGEIVKVREGRFDVVYQ